MPEMNRRKVLETVGTAGAVSISGVAAAGTGDSEVIRKTQTRPSERDFSDVLTNGRVENLLSTTNTDLGEIETGSAEKVQVYNGGELLTEAFRIPTATGDLKVTRRGGEIGTVALEVTKSEISSDLATRLSGPARWPDEKTATLVDSGDSSPVLFSWTVEQEERRRVVRSAETAASTAPDRSVVNYYHAIGDSGNTLEGEEYPSTGYKVHDRDSGAVSLVSTDGNVVENIGGRFQAEYGCSEWTAGCVFDVMMMSGCGAASMACGVTGVGVAPCIVAFLALCAPDVALVAVSGNCQKMAETCL